MWGLLSWILLHHNLYFQDILLVFYKVLRFGSVTTKLIFISTAFCNFSCTSSIQLGIAKPLDFPLPLEPNTAIFLFKYVFIGRVITSPSSVSPSIIPSLFPILKYSCISFLVAQFAVPKVPVFFFKIYSLYLYFCIFFCYY